MYTKKHIGALFLVSLTALMGCSHNHNMHGHDGHKHQFESYSSLVNWQQPSHVYKPKYTHKLLSDYSEKLAMELVENMRYVKQTTPIAVSSFVDLNNNLKTISILGNQLAESFIHELQEYGLSVVDYKHTGEIEVAPNGDFIFSRNNHELKNTPNIEYVLSGTLIYNDRGAVVNARIIGRHSKVVVSTASAFIPAFMIESLQAETGKFQDGVRLIKSN